MQLAESLIYVCWLIADHPRAIDRYIDYFGEGCVDESRRETELLGDPDGPARKASCSATRTSSR